MQQDFCYLFSGWGKGGRVKTAVAERVKRDDKKKKAHPTVPTQFREIAQRRSHGNSEAHSLFYSHTHPRIDNASSLLKQPFTWERGGGALLIGVELAHRALPPGRRCVSGVPSPSKRDGGASLVACRWAAMTSFFAVPLPQRSVSSPRMLCREAVVCGLASTKVSIGWQ